MHMQAAFGPQSSYAAEVVRQLIASFRTDFQLQLWGSQSLTRFFFDYWLHHLAGLQLPHQCFSQRFDAATLHNDFSIVFDG
jgi:hypothetical protein